MELDLECVASFLVLCEEEHFGRAAARLHLTASALSKRLQRLEHQVGTRLVERGPTGTTALTAAGWRFAEQATAVIDQAHHAQFVAREAASTPIHDVVRVGIPGIISATSTPRPLTGPIQGLQGRIPGVKIQCIGIPYGSTLDCLLNNMVDILWSPVDIKHSALDSRPLGAVSRVGVVPAQHFLAKSGTVNVEEFANLPLLRPPGLPLSQLTTGLLGDIRPLTRACLIPTNAQGVAALRQNILRGQGVAVMPFTLALEVGTGLRTVTLHDVPDTYIYAVYRRANEGFIIQEIINFLQEITQRAQGKRDHAQINSVNIAIDMGVNAYD